jgi:pimeloyl-ACP methyl ester carboxylesterase
MARFASYDGTQIGYRVLGAGPPLVCLPGGPGRASEYLGDLGGLSRSRQLIMPDTRGTGEPADASDPVSYRCDRLAGDVEALRAHLGLDRMDLLGHSAGGGEELDRHRDRAVIIALLMTSILGRPCPSGHAGRILLVCRPLACRSLKPCCRVWRCWPVSGPGW